MGSLSRVLNTWVNSHGFITGKVPGLFTLFLSTQYDVLTRPMLTHQEDDFQVGLN